MAKTFLVSSNTAFGSSTANTTAYIPPIGSSPNTTLNNVEDNAKALLRTPGTLSGLNINIHSNSVSGGTSTVVLRINGANANNTLSIGASTTGQFLDTSSTDTISAGDIIDIAFTPGAAAGTVTVGSSKLAFDTNASATSTVSRVGAFSASPNSSTTSNNSTYYFSLFGVDVSTNTNEANTQVQQNYAGTFKNMAIKVTTNSRANTTTVRFRKNTANGNMNIPISAGTTGWFEDTTNTDTVAVNDLCNFSLSMGAGTVAFAHTGILADYETTTNPGTGQLGLGYFTTVSFNKATTGYMAFSGRLGTDANESKQQTKVNDAYTFKGIGIRLSANTVTATSHMIFRVNSTDTALDVSMAASTTGWFTDTSHNITTTDGDLVNMKLATGATGTSITMTAAVLYTEIAGTVTDIDMTPNLITLQNKFITKI